MIKKIAIDRTNVIADGKPLGYLSLWIRRHFGIEDTKDSKNFSVEITEGEDYIFIPYVGYEGRQLVSLCKVEGTKNSVIGNICREKMQLIFPEIKKEAKYNITVTEVD